VHFTSAAEGWAVGWDGTNTRGVLLHYLAVSPNKGTIGTRFTIAGSSLGSKKGKVLIGDTAVKVTTWDASSISCEMNKTLTPGSHNVVIQPKTPRGALDITHPGAFTMMAPEIQVVKPASGPAKTAILLSGMFLGTKKGKVYLGDKKCKVLSWNMNATTGEGGIQFVVPDKMAPGPYNVTVTNKVDSVTLADGFTIIVP
jgi:translation elongation factor P/translation initiation factor 5A